MNVELTQPDDFRVVSAGGDRPLARRDGAQVQSLLKENESLRKILRETERSVRAYERELSKRMATEMPPITEADEAEMERILREGSDGPSMEEFIRELSGDEEFFDSEHELDTVVRLQRDFEDIKRDREFHIESLIERIDRYPGLVTFGETRYFGDKPISDVRAWLVDLLG